MGAMGSIEGNVFGAPEPGPPCGCPVFWKSTVAAISKVNKETLKSLEDAERVYSNPKENLTGWKIGYPPPRIKQNPLLTRTEKSRHQENYESVSECIRRIMLTKAIVREQSSGNKDAAPRSRQLSAIPPGGELNVQGVPGKSAPAVEDLSIKRYSNDNYWQFAPYLDVVRQSSSMNM